MLIPIPNIDSNYRTKKYRLPKSNTIQHYFTTTAAAVTSTEAATNSFTATAAFTATTAAKSIYRALVCTTISATQKG